MKKTNILSVLTLTTVLSCTTIEIAVSPEENEGENYTLEIIIEENGYDGPTTLMELAP